jgi:hypothetical protein
MSRFLLVESALLASGKVSHAAAPLPKLHPGILRKSIVRGSDI